ncbi:hypothetical protein ABIF97_001017 [Bradyrhizobium japonicum]
MTLFWAAFILTRPLGATVGDFLDKPVKECGLALSRPVASAVIAAFIIVCLLMLPQRAGRHPQRAAEFANNSDWDGAVCVLCLPPLRRGESAHHRRYELGQARKSAGPW